MASVAGVSAPICERSTISGNQPKVDSSTNETASQTFKIGTPVQVTTGAVLEWAGDPNTTNGTLIYGITKKDGASLATAGVALQKSWGSVPFESSAAKFLRPFYNDGKANVVLAVDDTIFYGQVGAASLSGVYVGARYGLTKDTDGHWYVDTSKTTNTAGSENTAVEIVGFDSWDTDRGVLFKFLKKASQLGY